MDLTRTLFVVCRINFRYLDNKISRHVQIQLEVCHLTKVSVAANLANQNALGVACKAIGEVKRSLLFLTTHWNELKLTNRAEGPSSLISLSWQHSCWSNGKTLAESAYQQTTGRPPAFALPLKPTVVRD